MNETKAERLFKAKVAFDTAKDTYETLRDEAIEEFKALRKGTPTESVKVTIGRFQISVAYNDTMVSVAWERIVERLQELLPTVSAILANVMRGSYVNDKGEKVPYVKPSPRAPLSIKALS